MWISNCFLIPRTIYNIKSTSEPRATQERSWKILLIETQSTLTATTSMFQTFQIWTLNRASFWIIAILHNGGWEELISIWYTSRRAPRCNREPNSQWDQGTPPNSLQRWSSVKVRVNPLVWQTETFRNKSRRTKKLALRSAVMKWRMTWTTFWTLTTGLGRI